MLSTKITMFLGTSPLPLPPSPPQVGIWAVLHEIRSEFAQIMCTLFLLIEGPGPWSLDAVRARVRLRRSGATSAGSRDATRLEADPVRL
jgi:putative oxidoreductase